MRRRRTRRTGKRLANWIIQWGEHKRRKQINGHFQGWICPCCWPLHSPCVEKQQGRRPRPVGTVVCGCEHWKGRRVGRRILGPPVCRYFTRLYKQHNINGWNNRSRIILYSQYYSEGPLPPSPAPPTTTGRLLSTETIIFEWERPRTFLVVVKGIGRRGIGDDLKLRGRKREMGRI